MTDLLHAITPGDHFSPRTGSAIPTVVDGLTRASAGEAAPFRHVVVLDRSTMRPRYPSALVIEYTGEPRVSRLERYRDLVSGRLALPRSGIARYYGPVAAAIRDHGSGVVVAHNAPILPWMLRDSAQPTILFIHNELLRTYSRAEATTVLGRADRIVCVSPWLAERTASRLPSRVADRVRVVPNGVDTERFHPADPDGDGAEQGPLRVLFVGRTIELKGPDVLVSAVAMLDRDDIELRIVGSHGFARGFPLTPYELRLRQFASGNPGITFEPFVDRDALPAVYAGADVLVVPSVRSEASGLTAGEGMASGLAVIASRVGGLPSVIGDAGLVVPPNDPGALAAAIAGLADDRERLRAVKDAARERALTHDWAWAWSHFRAVLEEL